MATGEYLSCLRDFWAKNHQTALESASSFLVEKIDDKNICKFYRLWIEVLAESKDLPGLRAVGEHLKSRGSKNKKYEYAFFGLRGLIHLELDEVEASSLHYKILKQNKSNLYALEFVTVYEQRKLPDLSHGLWEKLDAMEDYFHFQTLLATLDGDKQSKKQKLVLQIIEKVFPNAPLHHQYNFHHAWKKKSYLKAFESAQQLTQLYPANVDYRVYLGMSCIKNGWLDQAIDTLESTLTLSDFQDPDVLNALSYCYEEVGGCYKNSELLDQASQLAAQAQELYQSTGLPSTLVNARASRLQSAGDSEADSQATANKPWILQLNAQKFYDLMKEPEEAQRFMTMSLDIDAKPGDLCLLTGRSLHGEAGYQFRIGALCRVESPRTWHPTEHASIGLKMLHKVEQSIPLNIEFVDVSEQNQQLLHETAYELDSQSIELIINEIIEYRDQQEGKIWRELLTMGQAS